MAASGHFVWPKIAFDHISRHFRSIRNFIFCSQIGLQRPFFGHPKWLPAAILDDRKSLSITFQINMQLWFFKFSSQNGLPAAILDDRKSILNAFLAISDQCATFPFFVHKMAAGGHFGLPKIAFDHISRHFRSIRNFFFNFHKMAAVGHFGWPKITFECISRHFRSIQLFFFETFSSKWPPADILEIRFGPFWLTENHFRSHFSPFQINTQLFFSKWKSDLRQRQ